MTSQSIPPPKKNGDNSLPYQKELHQVVTQIKEEPFLFVIAIAILLFGIVVFATRLNPADLRFMVVIISLLAFVAILGHFVQTALQMTNKSGPLGEIQVEKGSAFWDRLSDEVTILFGVDYPTDNIKGIHPTISIRDLDATVQIIQFLAQRNSNQRIFAYSTTTPGWQRFLRESKSDIITVGGFVTNTEFRRYSKIGSRQFALKMGRLCRYDGQRVYHVQFGEHRLKLNNLSPPSRSEPQEIELFPSEYVSQDFGYIFSAQISIYGVMRRVIGIAGIKGNGTLAAARYVTKQLPHLESILQGRFDEEDLLELVVKADVPYDMTVDTEIVEVTINGTGIFDNSSAFWKKCELGRECEGCTFGDSPLMSQQIMVKAIVFDLDDTLVDTFGQIIAPLEVKAAEKMQQLDSRLPAPDELAEILLTAGKKSPSLIEEELRQEIPFISDKVLEARRRVFDNIDLSGIFVEEEIKLLLRQLRGKKYRLFLLTKGELAYQNRKLEQLGIRAMFDEIKIVSDSKRDALKAIATRYNLAPDSILVVGNRLDEEILDGSILKMPTVWVRRGEGSTPSMDDLMNIKPTFEVTHVVELRKILDT